MIRITKMFLNSFLIKNYFPDMVHILPININIKLLQCRTKFLKVYVKFYLCLNLRGPPAVINDVLLSTACLFTAGSTYCTRLSAKAYSDNAETTTKEELWSLLRTIHENSALSGKERRRLLGQFYKGHPEIFVQYFGNRLSTVNMLLQ